MTYCLLVQPTLNVHATKMKVGRCNENFKQSSLMGLTYHVADLCQPQSLHPQLERFFMVPFGFQCLSLSHFLRKLRNWMTFEHILGSFELWIIEVCGRIDVG